MAIVSTMLEFAYGKEVNFKNEIATPVSEFKTLDFSKDVDGYGFAIRDGKDCNLKGIQNLFIDVLAVNKLDGIIEFKTENSQDVPERSIPLRLDRRGWVYHVPRLSSPLKEIVIWFPKKLNKTVHTNSIRIEFVEIV